MVLSQSRIDRSPRQKKRSLVFFLVFFFSFSTFQNLLIILWKKKWFKIWFKENIFEEKNSKKFSKSKKDVVPFFFIYKTIKRFWNVEKLKHQWPFFFGEGGSVYPWWGNIHFVSLHSMGIAVFSNTRKASLWHDYTSIP